MRKAIFMIIFLLAFMCVSGCDLKNDTGGPEMLDGPGMVYIDSDYRTDYANILPFDEQDGYPFWAVAYIGKGDAGKNSRQLYINALFAEIPNDKAEEIVHFDAGGDEWYLVIPRYRDFYDIMTKDEKLIGSVHHGTPFTVCCNDNCLIRYYGHGGSEFSPENDGEKLICTDAIWDITEYVKNRI